MELVESGEQGISNDDGKCVFRQISGTITLRVRALGFVAQLRKIDGNELTKNKITIQLEEDLLELGEVVINSTAEELAGNEIFTPDVLSFESIRATPQAVPSILGQLPGIRIRQEGGLGSNSNIMLNGIGGKGVKIFVDDLPAYLLGSAFNINNISPNMISRIEVYKGLIPVEFGSDALGGIVNIVSRYGNAEYIDVSYTYGSWNTHQTSFNSRKSLDANDKFFVSLDGSYNYSGNNYWMNDVEIVTDTVNFNTALGKARRFNDSFKSFLGRMQVGARNISWADELIITGSYSHIDKEWQHGIRADVPWGEPISDEDSWSGAVTWREHGTNNRWNIKVTAGYSYHKLHFVDTARKTYYWDQNYQYKITGGESAIYSNGTTPELKTNTFFSRGSINYNLAKNHTLNLTHLLTRDELRGRNKAVSQDNQAKFSTPQTLLKNFGGLALESNMANSRLKNILSVKHYYSKAEGLDYLSTRAEFGDLIKTTSSILGYGDVVQILWKNLSFNIGYEFTVRQPDKEEIFGDYITIAPNAELAPEKSHNLNLGSEWESQDHRLSSGVSLFYRSTHDRIFINALTYGLSQYVNLLGTETIGGNAYLDYNLLNGLNASFNITYQDITLSEADPAGKLNDLIGARVPNLPYLFGNAQLSYINDQLIKKGQISLVYDFNYVNEFLLSWDQKAKDPDIIPTQLQHNINIAWLESKDRWSIGFECRNLFNAKVFDNFSVQRPGRSFYVKVRWFLDLK
ncbi:MAG: TonB-dependent receptor plug domain-containing protein [Cytophagales bacterium]|nr:TonB-dependent receptor plug domain-containing protein [Cytophagales bacterium]